MAKENSDKQNVMGRSACCITSLQKPRKWAWNNIYD